MSTIDRRIIDVQNELAAKEVVLRGLRSRLINTVGTLHTAKQLREADLDQLIMDATAICQLQTQVTALLRSLQELGSA